MLDNGEIVHERTRARKSESARGHRDCAFTEGPLLPHVYGAWKRIVGDYTIPPPSTLPAGRYQLTIGMYDPATGARLAGRASEDTTPQDEILLGEIEIR